MVKMSLKEFEELAKDPLVSDEVVLAEFQNNFAGTIEMDMLQEAVRIFDSYRPDAYADYRDHIVVQEELYP